MTTPHDFCSDSDTYRETLDEVVAYFGGHKVAWDNRFRRFLRLDFEQARTMMDPYERAVCHHIYVTEKRKHAFITILKSRAKWREAAIELGHDGKLAYS
jgi:hypothetical protein